MRHLSFFFPFLGLLAACTPGGRGTPDDDDDDDAVEACAYPEGAVEPMALGEVITPYSWPTALAVADGSSAPLDVADVPCNTSDDIDWSPFDVLLFVSIPAW